MQLALGVKIALFGIIHQGEPIPNQTGGDTPVETNVQISHPPKATLAHVTASNSMTMAHAHDQVADLSTCAQHAKKKAMVPTLVPVGKGVALDIQNRKMQVSIRHASCNYNCVCCAYPSPIIVSNLIPLLNLYPLTTAAQTLKEGFMKGFKLGFEGKRCPREAKNLISVLKDPNTAQLKLEKEISLKRMAGPFNQAPIENLFVSPIGLVPKAEKGKLRMIHHLSYPEGESVNDGINRDVCAVHYANFDEAVNIVIRAGKGAHMVKADIESAFRLLPVHPSDFNLLGIKFRGKYYVDKALPMGASCSPAFFEMFSSFLDWVVRQEVGSDKVIHYMDDFLFVGCADVSNKLSCQRLVTGFERVCKKLGVPLAANKSVGPTSCLVFLGLEIDSIRQTVSIPSDKLEKVTEKIKHALENTTITLKELQSLIGSLTFVCKAVTPGRAFLRRLIDLTCNIKKSWHKIRLSKGAREDLGMWMVFLKDFNGRAIFPEQFWRDNEDLQLFTDSSGRLGFGGFLDGKWFQGEWPKSINQTKFSIAWLEFFPIVVAVTLWGNLLKGKRIIIRSDNAAAVAIINKQSSKCPIIMRLVRFFVLQCLKSNLAFSAQHISGKANTVADALSRFQMRRFREAAPDADLTGTPVPSFLWDL